jgi:putative transposase
MKRGLEASLSVKSENHIEGSDISIRENSTSSKQMQNDVSSFNLDVPRDKASSFEPQIVRKRHNILTDELDAKLLELYGRSNSYKDISKHLQELYGAEISENSYSSPRSNGGRRPSSKESRTRSTKTIILSK